MLILVLIVMQLIIVLALIFAGLNWCWNHLVEPAVERWFAKRKGWDDDWLQRAKERDH